MNIDNHTPTIHCPSRIPCNTLLQELDQEALNSSDFVLNNAEGTSRFFITSDGNKIYNGDFSSMYKKISHVHKMECASKVRNMNVNTLQHTSRKITTVIDKTFTFCNKISKLIL